MLKGFLLAFSSVFIFFQLLSGQVEENEENMILFRGLVMDASTLSPLSDVQIIINRAFSSVSDQDGSFAFYVNRNDTIVFSILGYKQALLGVNDTLKGKEFIAGIYMHSDTISIPEVIIIPGIRNLKYEILNTKSSEPAAMENARYNVAISAYQGRVSQNQLGNPADNYNFISQKQKIDAFEKGGIPSDQIVGLNPLIFIPAAYLLLHGLPESPAAPKPQITGYEVKQVHDRYLEMLKQKNSQVTGNP